MPNTSIITISQKIEDEKKRQELKDLIKNILPKNFGAIIRTSAENAKNEEMKTDLEQLLKTWNDINNKYKKSADSPQLIWKSENIVEKIITDLSRKDLVITTNSKEEFDKLTKSYKETEIKVQLDKKNNLLEKYQLAKQIEQSKERRIWLNCGGFITIDKTEALTAIDVNTGKFTGKRDLESTLLKVNKEATIEIAKQLRLRDIGGIIIIDYIDMREEESKKKIVDLLKEELKKDRAKTQVEGFTKLNLMEMTRKHICSHLNG